MRYSLPGPIAVRSVGTGRLCLTAEAPYTAAEVFLHVDADGAAQRLWRANSTTLLVEWRDDGTYVSLGTAPPIRVRSAFIHESNQALYRALPLAAFDAGARRFWRRVFALLRFPGGKLLLKVIARRRA